MIYLRYGSRGPEVADLQVKLNSLGYAAGTVDGMFGTRTQAAVVLFQKEEGLRADGVVGPSTMATLATAGPMQYSIPPLLQPPQSTDVKPNWYTQLAPVARRPTVEQAEALQADLKSAGYNPGPVDGVIGPTTRSAIKELQRDLGQDTTGVPTIAFVQRLKSIVEKQGKKPATMAVATIGGARVMGVLTALGLFLFLAFRR